MILIKLIRLISVLYFLVPLVQKKNWTLKQFSKFSKFSKFTEVTGETKFSKNIFQVRWTDNSNTAQVAFDVLNSVIKFIETTYKIPKRNSNENKVISNNEIILALGNHH